MPHPHLGCAVFGSLEGERYVSDAGVTSCRASITTRNTISVINEQVRFLPSPSSCAVSLKSKPSRRELLLQRLVFCDLPRRPSSWYERSLALSPASSDGAYF